MAFTIADNDESFASNPQSIWMQTDINAIIAGIGGDGVVSGCAVTAQGSPDMTVAVAVGVINIAGAAVAVVAGNVTITAADVTNPRVDLVVVSNAGVKSVTAGTAAANPKAPDIPANSVLLAMVYVPANDTTIATNQITDKRVIAVALISGGGTLALGGFIGTLPATGTFALKNIDNAFSAAQRIVQSGTPQATSYAFSIQSNNSATWMEILNNVGSGNGVFFGVTGNEFQLQNFQGGDISFWTASNRRVIVTNAGRVGIGVTSPSALLHTYAYDSDVGIAPVMTLTHGAATTAPGAGYGARQLWQLDSSTYTLRDVAIDDVVWVTATDASRAARRIRYIYDTAARETMREEANGSAAMIGFLGGNAVVKQTSGANVTNNVTAGGTDDTIANYTDLIIYANDAAAIRNDIYQLARKVKQLNDGLRAFTLFT